ncbi:MAG TPA: proton-conducting transporter membrane subunit [Phycisphaerae bacterium]|nr:proton-conducting transporter membrane subunit [Phycisphaerae bacterium]
MHDFQALIPAAVVPFIISICIILIRGFRSAKAALYISLSARLLSLVIVVYSIAHHLSNAENGAAVNAGTVQFHWLPLWFSGPHSTEVWLNIGAFTDTRGFGMFLCILAISTIGHIYLLSSVKNPVFSPLYFIFCDVMVIGLLLTVISPDLLQMYVCLAISSAGAWFMLNTVWRTSQEHATWKWMVPICCSDALLLLGIVISCLHFGVVVSSLIPGYSPVFSTGAVLESKPLSDNLDWYDYMGFCLVAGALGRAAQFPFHTWLARLNPAASPAIAAFAPGMVIATSSLLLFRILPFLSDNVKLIVMLCGTATVLIGSLTAVVQTNIKQLVLSIIIAQSGLCFALLGCGATDVALAAAIVLSLAASGILLTTGTVLAATNGLDDLHTLGGLWRKLPITALTSLMLIFLSTWVGGPGPSHILVSGLQVFQHNLLHVGGYQRFLFWGLVLGCYIMALAICRWWWLIFLGSSRSPEIPFQRETPAQTLALLLILLMAFIAGQPFISLDNLLSGTLTVENTVVLNDQAESLSSMVCNHLQWSGLTAMLIVMLMYFSGMGFADRIRRFPGLNLLFRWLNGGFFFSDLYSTFIGRPIRLLSYITAFLDRWVITWVLLTAALSIRGAAMIVGSLEWNISSRIWDFLTGDMLLLNHFFRFLRNRRISVYIIFLFIVLVFAGGALGIMAFLFGKS